MSIPEEPLVPPQDIIRDAISAFPEAAEADREELFYALVALATTQAADLAGLDGVVESYMADKETAEGALEVAERRATELEERNAALQAQLMQAESALAEANETDYYVNYQLELLRRMVRVADLAGGMTLWVTQTDPRSMLLSLPGRDPRRIFLTTEPIGELPDKVTFFPKKLIRW